MPKVVKIGLFLTVPILFYCAGIATAVYVRNFPFLTLNKEVGVTELANLLLTIIVAFWIPITLNPLITNKRAVKDFLMSEVKDCIIYFESIKDKIDSAAFTSTTKKEKGVIISMIGQGLSIKISSITNQLEDSFKTKSDTLCTRINQAYLQYWKESTDGNLMADSFKFDIGYSNQHSKAFSKLEHELKRAVYAVNEY